MSGSSRLQGRDVPVGGIGSSPHLMVTPRLPTEAEQPDYEIALRHRDEMPNRHQTRPAGSMTTGAENGADHCNLLDGPDDDDVGPHATSEWDQGQGGESVCRM